MSEEVYDGAIGIDLGMYTNATISTTDMDFDGQTANAVAQVRPTLASPTTKATMSKLVSSFVDTYPKPSLIRLLVANEQGSFTTPSFVSFTDEERLIGEAAKNQAAMNPANTVFDVK